MEEPMLLCFEEGKCWHLIPVLLDAVVEEKEAEGGEVENVVCSDCEVRLNFASEEVEPQDEEKEKLAFFEGAILETAYGTVYQEC